MLRRSVIALSSAEPVASGSREHGMEVSSILESGTIGRNWYFHKLHRRLIQKICGTIYCDTNRDLRRSVVIAGTARSGTTWLGDIIASQIACRVMFEPFHPGQVPQFRQFKYFQYMRPTAEDPALWSYCRQILTGDIRNKWIDRQVENIFPKYRVIKEIRANLFLKWLQTNFPEVPILFIMRHPCAVVASRMDLGWATDDDIRLFLAQQNLVDDFLTSYLHVIEGAKTPEEKHAVIWCISNLVPIRQFRPGELPVVFYEKLSVDPGSEIPRIFQLLRHRYENTVYDYARQPSVTTRAKSAVITGTDQLNQWRAKLSRDQIVRILSIVEKFDLGHIYNDSSFPASSNL
jgi:hypothetical protein